MFNIVFHIKTKKEYGCDNPGWLKSVLMHVPGEELKLINKSNYKKWLFDRVSDVEVFVVLLLDCIANKYFLYYITNMFC